jgi:chemotaxis protein CheD
MAGLLQRIATVPRPACVPGFEAVQRYWDPAIERWTAKILPGEYYVTRSQEAVSTVLGSCIAACVRDTSLQVGGMNHFMLPEDGAGGSGSWNAADGGASTRYGTYAMESLINGLLKLGARRERLEVKLFGGGRILANMTDVGNRNIAFALEFLKQEGLKVASQDVGDIYPRRVLYFPETGRVLVKRLRAVDGNVVASRENSYRATLGTEKLGNDVELFD